MCPWRVCGFSREVLEGKGGLAQVLSSVGGRTGVPKYRLRSIGCKRGKVVGTSGGVVSTDEEECEGVRVW